LNVREFFESPVMALPRDRDEEDFELYLKKIFDAYLATIKKLDPGCHLCQRIQAAAGDIQQLSEWIGNAVRHYLSGKPAEAYHELLQGIDFVRPLMSKDIGSNDVGGLYRLADTKGKPAPKERLFHTPFHLRHKVRQHRYGIPGFPCLYLGGSLELCVEECRIDAATLPGVAVAEFGLRKNVKVLDFGYRPEALARLVAGSAMSKRGSNPGLEKLIIAYATCWPLMAASAIKVLHDGEPFVYEYIVPQMILQWAMSTTECDGIRFFSTRFTPDPDAIRGAANYVFPATHDVSPTNQYSQRLRDLFELTEPMVWGPPNGHLRQDARDKESAMNVLPRTPL
jgi:hypothetical protein